MLEITTDDIQVFNYEGDLCIWDLDKGPPPEDVPIADLVTHRVEGAWNITLAKELVKGRSPFCMIYPAELASIGKNVTVDHDHAMTTDLNDPVIAIILALDEMKDMFIIDGWHRIHKAVYQSVENIPCCLLSEEETELVTLSWTVTHL